MTLTTAHDIHNSSFLFSYRRSFTYNSTLNLVSFLLLPSWTSHCTDLYSWHFITFPGGALLPKTRHTMQKWTNQVSPHYNPPIVNHFLFVMLCFQDHPITWLGEWQGTSSSCPHPSCFIFLSVFICSEIVCCFCVSKLLNAHTLVINVSKHLFFRCHPTIITGKSMIKTVCSCNGAFD